jgi:hypothetical protein
MLLPSARTVAVYDTRPELAWCSDGYERPELRIRYAEAEGDFDDDGDADDDDAEIETRLAIWRQEAEGLPFLRLGTVRFDDLDEVEADLSGFTRYAIAY